MGFNNQKTEEMYTDITVPQQCYSRQLLGVEQVAHYLGVSRWTVRRLVNKGQLPAPKVGRCLRIRQLAIDEAICSREERGAR